jgi:hypothetical protein
MRVSFGLSCRTVAEAVHQGRAEFSRYDVGLSDQPLQQFPVARRFDVETNAFLATVETHKVS